MLKFCCSQGRQWGNDSESWLTSVKSVYNLSGICYKILHVVIVTIQ